MPSDYESGAKKTIDISIKAEKMTADVLKSALQEFLSGKAEKKGRMTFKQLQAKSPSKLDSIEVSDRNIGDFLKTARKYDVDFALKRDKSTSPPTYHVFFSAAKTEDFKRAWAGNPTIGCPFLDSIRSPRTSSPISAFLPYIS